MGTFVPGALAVTGPGPVQAQYHESLDQLLPLLVPFCG